MEEETGETEAILADCGGATDVVKALCGSSLAVDEAGIFDAEHWLKDVVGWNGTDSMSEK
jgi:hypothetical protein